MKVKGKLLSQKNCVQAVNGITFDVYKGETLGIVGESGCGKSTTGRAVVRLERPTAGQVLYKNQDIWKYDKEQLFSYRKKAQMIFQDAYSTLDPRFTVGRSIMEPLVIHGIGTKEEREKRGRQLMEDVGLPVTYFNRYPHEFSGGQRQRIGVARALTLSPEILVCDEPVSALDVSVQAQILNLMKDLQGKFGLTYIFISHNLSVVKHLCDRIGVIYLGNLVELAGKEELFKNMLHPYTQALISAIPIPDPSLEREKILLEGDVPTPINPPKGCPFATRCMYAAELCKRERPGLEDVGGGHRVACHIYGGGREEMRKQMEEKGIAPPRRAGIL
ncbi:MAG: ATP-binding cassette domain-containing protein [Clostridium sp.]|nr:ATP-binding cassette domain-containing protein [Clostridium sp.]